MFSCLLYEQYLLFATDFFATDFAHKLCYKTCMHPPPPPPTGNMLFIYYKFYTQQMEIINMHNLPHVKMELSEMQAFLISYHSTPRAICRNSKTEYLSSLYIL